MRRPRAAPAATLVALATLLAVATDCASATKAPAALEAGTSSIRGACRACAAYADAEEVAKIASNDLVELSGLATSRRHKGVFYTHNDSGDRARFFAIDERATLRATYDLDGVVATDIEDVDVGPCAAGSCVFLGDIGDNEEKRTEIRIYRLPEPELSSTRLVPEVLTVTYPDGAHNAETLMVSPESGELVIVTKSASGRSSVYTLPSGTPPGRATLRKISELVVPVEGVGLVTGGSFHPCEKRVALRTYPVILEYRFTGGLETMFAAPPTVIPSGREPQGESVTYSADGAALFTVSEGIRAPLHRSACSTP